MTFSQKAAKYHGVSVGVAIIQREYIRMRIDSDDSNVLVFPVQVIEEDYTSAKPYFYGTGRRKFSIARVRLVPGSGDISINGRNIDDYFGIETLKMIVRQPFAITGTDGKFDIICTVKGGGISGQAGAVRHGVARALLQANEEYRLTLKKAGLLTRDPRMKERKKYGLKAARRASQFSKR